MSQGRPTNNQARLKQAAKIIREVADLLHHTFLLFMRVRGTLSVHSSRTRILGPRGVVSPRGGVGLGIEEPPEYVTMLRRRALIINYFTDRY